MKLLLNKEEMSKFKEMIAINNEMSYEEIKKVVDKDLRYREVLEIIEQENGTTIIDIKPWVTVGVMSWYNKYSKILIPLVQSLFEVYSSASEELSVFIQENSKRIRKSLKCIK